MKVFVAGASGALGVQLVPKLVAAGHDVVAMTKTPSKQDRLRDLGAQPVVADALDPDAVAEGGGRGGAGGDRASAHGVVGDAERSRHAPPRPLSRAGHDQPTAYRGDRSPPGRRLRRGGTALRGAELRGLPLRPDRRACVHRGRSPRSPTTHRPRCGGAGELPLPRAGGDDDTWGEGLALRYGSFYGRDRDQLGAGCRDVRADPQRRFPIVGGGGGVWSTSTSDAAAATVAAVERGHPASTTSSTTTPPPCDGSRHWPRAGGQPAEAVPRWFGRLAAGEAATAMMTKARGASNAKAKRELDWRSAIPAGDRASPRVSGRSDALV